MNTVLIILAIGAAAAAAWYFWQRRPASSNTDAIWRALNGLGIPKSKSMFAFDHKTPGGVPVRSTVEVPAAALEMIDNGIREQIVRHNAAYPAWSRGRTLPEYSVLFVDPMAFNEVTDPGSPAILIQGIQSAGTVIGMNEMSPVRDTPHIVLPHQEAANWSHLDYLMHSAWAESEHCREWMNRDLEPVGKWQEYEGANDVHPHVA